jgi:hypothetical protein
LALTALTPLISKHELIWNDETIEIAWRQQAQGSKKKISKVEMSMRGNFAKKLPKIISSQN